MLLQKSFKILFVLFVFAVFHLSAVGQVYRVAEMNTKQIQSLDKQKTVVILTGGVLEQHGPFIPSFSDGYMNERLSRDVADAIVAQLGRSVMMFPKKIVVSLDAKKLGF